MEYIHIHDNVYKQSYIRPNGKPANRYFVKNNCSNCNNEFFQYRTNWQRSKGVGYCSKTCKAKSQEVPEGSKKLKRGPNCDGHNAVLVKQSNHPAAKKGFVYEHRLVMEEYINRYLTDKERVHHINMDPLDNDLENLYLCEHDTEHNLAHASLNDCVKELIEMGVLTFENGRYKTVNNQL